jgi:hypothetical protein
MRLSPFTLALTLAAALGVVTACTPAPVAPAPTSSLAPVTPTSSAAPVVTPSAEATLSGDARYFGAPFADAEVLVVPVGQMPSVVGRTDAQGHFAVTPPAGSGSLRVVVRKGTQHAATVVVTPARAVAALGDSILVDELGAFVYLTFAPRLVALQGLANMEGADPNLTAATLAALEEVVAALRATQAPVGQEAFEAVSGALDGIVATPDAATRASLIAATPPSFIDALVACGDKLNALIRTQVLERGLPMPAPALLEALQFGSDRGAFAPNVFESSSDNKGGGGSTGADTKNEPKIGEGGTIEFEPAPVPFADETASPTITTEDSVP